MLKTVLLDTSFMLRFLNENDPLFSNADEYYRYFLDHEFGLAFSTISVAEYCVGGTIEQLPLKNLKIIPFNLTHAKRTGEFARILYTERRAGLINFKERTLIPNDSKLFAQADTELSIEYFLTSDTESLKAYSILQKHTNPHFIIIDVVNRYTTTFGLLDL
jgi:predicted nucleic acid-binding protein